MFVQSTAERRKTKQSSGHIVRLLAPKSTRVVSLINSGRTRTPYMLHCSPGTRSRLVSVLAQWKFHHIRQIYLFHTVVANVDEPLRRGGVERTLEARMFRGPPLCVRRLNSNSKRPYYGLKLFILSIFSFRHVRCWVPSLRTVHVVWVLNVRYCVVIKPLVQLERFDECLRHFLEPNRIISEQGER